MTTITTKPLLLVLTAALSGAVLAETPPAAPTEKQAAASKPTIYGHQLMTDAERAEYREKMRALKTPEEREAFRAEHHKLMQARAKERGVTLPEMPPQQGMGKGMHQGTGQQGMGQGMHPGTGQGMGQGMHPGTGQGMGQGTHPGMGQGMHQGAGQEMHKGMGPGAQQGTPPEATPPASPPPK